MPKNKEKKISRRISIAPDRAKVNKTIKENLPHNWYAEYAIRCKKIKVTPKSYSHLTHIKNGRHKNPDHYSIILDIVIKCIDERIAKEKLMLQSRDKLSEIAA